ncbi:MAG: hypothetical protein AAF560_16300 [Acidobacteriota bacterium]
MNILARRIPTAESRAFDDFMASSRMIRRQSYRHFIARNGQLAKATSVQSGLAQEGSGLVKPSLISSRNSVDEPTGVIFFLDLRLSARQTRVLLSEGRDESPHLEGVKRACQSHGQYAEMLVGAYAF